MIESGTLTKARIAQALVDSNGYTQQKASETVEIILELIKGSLENGENHAIHGDVRFRPWQIETVEETHLACRFNSAYFLNINWPWAFEASVEYVLSGNRFTSRLTLWNRSDSAALPQPRGGGYAGLGHGRRDPRGLRHRVSARIARHP